MKTKGGALLGFALFLIPSVHIIPFRLSPTLTILLKLKQQQYM